MSNFRVILHLDMDAFYASIEQRDHPLFRGSPVIVGAHPSQRGVVCAASYEARRFGIHSAMPSAVAHRLCPHAVFLKPRMEVYAEESRHIMAALGQTGGVVEPASIDEAYLDLSSLCHGPDADASLLMAVPIAQGLKSWIATQRGLTATVGIASNKLLAKIASDFQKPNGLTVIPEIEKVQFLRPLPVRVLNGIGKVTERILHAAHLQTVGDLQDYAGDLSRIVGSAGPKLKAFAFGEDPRPLAAEQESKSFSLEKTFPADTTQRDLLFGCLWSQAEKLALKLGQDQVLASTVEIKVRYGDFTTRRRQVTLAEPTAEANIIYWHACRLALQERLFVRPVRLVGLGVSRFSRPLQLSLL